MPSFVHNTIVDPKGKMSKLYIDSAKRHITASSSGKWTINKYDPISGVEMLFDY